MRFSLGKSQRHRELCPSIVRLFPPISSASIVRIRQLVVQIIRVDVILMGYCMDVQVRTMMSIVMYNRRLRMGGGCP